jgi:hypothetical protein
VNRIKKRFDGPAALVCLIVISGIASVASSDAALLWSHPQKTLIRNNGAGEDILHRAVKPRDSSSSGTVFLRFSVDPQWDAITKGQSQSVSGLVFYEKGVEKLGVGNAPRAWGYSAFSVSNAGPGNKTEGEYNLVSALREVDPAGIYEVPRRGVQRTIVIKVDYLPGGLDNVAVWLNPDLSPGATELAQPTNLITQFKADASFNEIRLCHRGLGEGWIFSDLAIATAFEESGGTGRDL